MRSSLKGWLDQSVISRAMRAERREVPGLIAYHTEGSSALPDSVRNISASGMYLLTSARWSLGSAVDLTLQRHGKPEQYAENRVQMRAMPVRLGPDGIGLSFVQMKGARVRLWEDKFRETTEQIEPVDVVREFRVARAEAFLRRICPAVGDRASQALRSGVGSFRTESVIEIALRAEQSISSSDPAIRRRIHPDVLRQILENGSWAEVDWTRELWSNLLISSCSAAGTDRTGLEFTLLLSQMTLNQTRLLNWICGEASKQLAESGAAEPETVPCSKDRMKDVIGIGDLVRVEREVERLAELGLLKSHPRPTYFDDEDDLILCPTPLAMEFYARSRRQSESLAEMFKVSPVMGQASLSAGD